MRVAAAAALHGGREKPGNVIALEATNDANRFAPACAKRVNGAVTGTGRTARKQQESWEVGWGGKTVRARRRRRAGLLEKCRSKFVIFASRYALERVMMVI